MDGQQFSADWKFSAAGSTDRCNTCSKTLYCWRMAIDAGTHRHALQEAIETIRALSSSAKNKKYCPRAPYPDAKLKHEVARYSVKQMALLSLPLFVAPKVGGERMDIGLMPSRDTIVRRDS